jgi:hypothetical protein
MSASTLPTPKKKKKKKNIFDLGTKYIFVIEPGKILQGDAYNIYFSMHGILVNLLIT